MATYKKIVDVETMAEATETMNVLVENAGSLKKVPVGKIGGGSATFGDFSTTELLLPEQHIQCGYIGYSNAEILTDEQIIQLELGKMYRVNLDGIDYDCVCRENYVDRGGLYIGASVAYPDISEEAEYPFTYCVNDNFGGSTMHASEGEHTFSIFSINRDIRRIDMSFMPTAIIDLSNESAIVCTNMTYAEAVELLKVGKFSAMLVWREKDDSGTIIAAGYSTAAFVDFYGDSDSSSINLVWVDGPELIWTASGFTMPPA